VKDMLVWIDCEMTGLDLAHDGLIEVAALVTDGSSSSPSPSGSIT